jgi:hypothetical protein
VAGIAANAAPSENRPSVLTPRPARRRLITVPRGGVSRATRYQRAGTRHANIDLTSLRNAPVSGERAVTIIPATEGAEPPMNASGASHQTQRGGLPWNRTW